MWDVKMVWSASEISCSLQAGENMTGSRERGIARLQGHALRAGHGRILLLMQPVDGLANSIIIIILAHEHPDSCIVPLAKDELACNVILGQNH